MSACVCILDLVTRHANRIFTAPYYIAILACPRCTILPHVACPAVPYCHMWPVPLSHIVTRGLSRCTILPHMACPAVPYCHTWPVPLCHIATHGLSRTLFSHVACPAVPYCHTWPVPLSHIVTRGLSRCTILSHVACPAVPYCHTWPVPLYHIATCGLSRCTTFVAHYLKMARVAGEKKKHRKCVLVLFTHFDRNISHSTKNAVTYYHNCTQSASKVPITLVGF